MTQKEQSERGVKEKRIVVADSRSIRRARLVRVAQGMAGNRVIGIARSLTEAHNLSETHAPDAVILSSELAALPEFEMFYALLRMIGAECVIYGNATDFRGSEAVCMPLEVDADAIRIMRMLDEGALADTRKTLSMTGGDRAEPKSIVVIGASTGGVAALEEILMTFPSDCPPTAIVQHIRGDFLPGFVQRLNRVCSAEVLEATDGATMLKGRVFMATGNETHLKIVGRESLRCRMVPGDPVSGHMPSVDVLFGSVAHLGARVTAALLTGMGRDGASGLLEIKRRGGSTIAQDQASSVVYGMPRAAKELGAASQEVSLNRMAAAILGSAGNSAATAERGDK